MIGFDNLFALTETDALLREELGGVGTHASRRPAGRALIVQACAANRSLCVDTCHLTPVRIHVQQESMGGDVVCAAGALPWEDHAFQLVVAQHVGDVLPRTSGIVDELARILTPGGVLLWYGLNPWSPWLAWVHWRARLGMSLPQASHADSVRRQMMNRQLAVGAVDYLGACWPRFDPPSGRYPARVLAPLQRVYLLTASKQRAALTPLRPRLSRVRALAPPQLASTPSRRARA